MSGSRGNRIQLVAGEDAGIDHVAIETHDIEWAETFYTQVLGGQVQDRVGWRMDDYERANLWGNGEEDCAPGTRRWDKRYTTVEAQARMARPNAHFFVGLGGATLGIYLATEHRQEPRESSSLARHAPACASRPDAWVKSSGAYGSPACDA